MSREAGIEDLVKQIYRLGSIRRELLAHALPELGGRGFTALAAIYRCGPARISEIATHLGVDLSVASRQIKVLLEAGYVESRTDPADGRAQLLTVTESGRQALRRSHNRMVEVCSLALAGWDRVQLSDLVEGLERLRTAFVEAATADDNPGAAADIPGIGAS